MKSLPFEKKNLAEPMGLIGGILVLWNMLFIDFSLIGVDIQAIHGIAKVFSSPSPKVKSRVDT